MARDCRDCKYSYYEDLDNNLCCELTGKILEALIPAGHKGIPSVYELKYPNVCSTYNTGVKRGRKPWYEVKDLNYGTIKGKYSKYERGDVITDINVLLTQKVVIWGELTKNIAVLKNLPLRVIVDAIERGQIYYAVPKIKEVKQTQLNIDTKTPLYIYKITFSYETKSGTNQFSNFKFVTGKIVKDLKEIEYLKPKIAKKYNLNKVEFIDYIITNWKE